MVFDFACHQCYHCTVVKDFSSCPNADWFHPADQPGWGGYSDLITLLAGTAVYRIPDGTSPEAVIAREFALPAVLQCSGRAGLAASQTGS